MNWEEQFDKKFPKAPETGFTKTPTEQLMRALNLKNFISSLLSSQEQKYKKEIEELIGDITLHYWPINGIGDLQRKLKSKYLTKRKE